MATINLGRIKPVWKNTWTATTAYVVDDIVRSGVTSYICINAHTSGASFAVGSDWSIMSQGSNVGTGTAGQVLKTNSGGNGVEWVDAGGGFEGMQVFTSNGTWTKPAGVKKIKVYVTGGGGGGGGGAPNFNHGGGGGAAGTAIKVIDVSSISSVTVTVGGHGAGGAANSIGTTGSTSSFGTHCSGYGGGRGRQAWANDGGGYGVGGSASGGQINLYGGMGGVAGGGGAHDETGSPGDGGASYWGGGGQAGAPGQNNDSATMAGKVAECYGAGGGAGDDNAGTSYPGASGKHGIVVVEEYK